LGACSAESENYLQSLSRPIDEGHVHIYFRKQAVALHNLNVISSMPGALHSYQCQDQGNVSGISCPAPVKLLLKPGAKVMLLWNLSQDLRNGSSGTFVREIGDQLEVEFPSVGLVRIRKQTWSNRDRSGEIVGSRTQYPVTLFYAATCHKVQGLTLPGAVVHCCKEFVPGLIYVAASRSRSEKICSFVILTPGSYSVHQMMLYVCVMSKQKPLMTTPAAKTRIYKIVSSLSATGESIYAMGTEMLQSHFPWMYTQMALSPHSLKPMMTT